MEKLLRTSILFAFLIIGTLLLTIALDPAEVAPINYSGQPIGIGGGQEPASSQLIPVTAQEVSGPTAPASPSDLLITHALSSSSLSPIIGESISISFSVHNSGPAPVEVIGLGVVLQPGWLQPGDPVYISAIEQTVLQPGEEMICQAIFSIGQIGEFSLEPAVLTSTGPQAINGGTRLWLGVYE